jgi:hypothetical protein
MPDFQHPPLFLLDANACNALQRIDELNEIELIAQEGIIDLLYTETTWDEARFGSSRRAQKVDNYFFIGLSVDDHNDQLQQPWRNAIAAIVFPAGVRTNSEHRDVEALLAVKMSGGYFVTRDGGSQSQPGGILGCKGKLAELGIEVLNFPDALAQARQYCSRPH